MIDAFFLILVESGETIFVVVVVVFLALALSISFMKSQAQVTANLMLFKGLKSCFGRT